MAKSKKAAAPKKKKSFENVTKPPEFLQKTPKASGVSLGKDKDGFFCYTHRCRSKSYKTIMGIPKKDIEFVESTG
jgi:hypothetical protein